MIYRSTKKFTSEQGLSCVFRQWRAESHCRFLHGYAIWIKFTFEARRLDDNGWVVDFGSLKPLKEQLAATFDHKLVIAEDDPAISTLLGLHSGLYDGQQGRAPQIADAIVLPGVGCEAFAKHCFNLGRDHLRMSNLSDRVFVYSCEVGEHDANSAIFTLGED